MERLADGRILLTYGNRATPGIEAMLSSDEGESRRKPIRQVDDISGDLGYLGSVQFADGKILTACYAREAPEHDGYHMGVVVWRPPAPAAGP